MQNPSNSEKPLTADALRAVEATPSQARRRSPCDGAEGVETRRGAPNAARTMRVNPRGAQRWRRHSPAHERSGRTARFGVERRSVTKIRRFTACRFESGPRHQGCSQQRHLCIKTPPVKRLRGFLLSPLLRYLILWLARSGSQCSGRVNPTGRTTFLKASCSPVLVGPYMGTAGRSSPRKAKGPKVVPGAWRRPRSRNPFRP